MTRPAYSSIPATAVGRLWDATSTVRYCTRCPQRIKPGARTTTKHCFDCESVVRMEQAAERHGIDLAALADDEWFNKYGRIKKVAA